jgi:hypothetical protein
VVACIRMAYMKLHCLTHAGCGRHCDVRWGRWQSEANLQVPLRCAHCAGAHTNCQGGLAAEYRFWAAAVPSSTSDIYQAKNASTVTILE